MEEDEISIDLGKVKNLFKRKKKETEKVGMEVKEASMEEGIEKEKTPSTGQKPSENTVGSHSGEDEINIDLGNIKKWFRKKEKAEDKHVAHPGADKGKHHPEKKEEKAQPEDEISLDFSKLKSLFKGSKEGSEKRDESEDDANVDIKKTLSAIKKHQKIVIPLILILIAMSLATYVRLQSADWPATDQWARNTVYDFYRNQIRSQVDQQYPNLPSQNRESFVDAEFQKLMETQKETVEQQIAATSQQFKDHFRDEQGYSYLPDIDPYFWLRHGQNVLENGHPGDTIINGRKWDTFMLAPLGRGLPPDMFHAYVEAYFYRMVRLFNPSLTLRQSVFVLPVIIAALSVIPAFFIGRRLGGNFTGFIAAALLAIHPAFLNRTLWGVTDTDGYNVLLPLVIVWLFLEGFETTDWKKSVALVALAGFVVGLFSFAWGGWWYIFDFVLISSILFLPYHLLVHRDEWKRGAKGFFRQEAIRNTFVVLIVFIISSMLFVTLFKGFAEFRVAPLQPFSFAKIKEVGVSKIWPNVLTTVAEQNEASLPGIISQIGGKFMFFIGLMGIIFIMTRKDKLEWGDIGYALGSAAWFLIVLNFKSLEILTFLVLISLPIVFKAGWAISRKEHEIDIKLALLLIMWFLATIYASTKGIRWILLLTPAFSLAFGIALGRINSHAANAISRSLKIPGYIVKPLIMIALLFLLVGTFDSAKGIARSEVPLINDAWYNALDKINNEASPDAIINSWWDFGHWFKSIGNRRVTFDGTSQNTPQAHWIGNVLRTPDEKTAVGILRMLDCGANTAFDELDKKVQDTAKSVDILYEIVVMDKAVADRRLEKEGLSKEERDAVLKNTHCTPPEDYFITSEDMVSKSGVWGHFGAWEFDRAQMYNTLQKKEYKNNKEKSVAYLKERFGMDDRQATDRYFEIQSLTADQVNTWIAPWPSYASGVQGCTPKGNDVFSCPVGGSEMLVDVKAREATMQTPNGDQHPKSIAFPTPDGVFVKEYSSNVVALQNGRPLGAALLPAGDSYSIVLMDADLTAGMFTRLFYMDGHGLSYFKKFDDQRSIFGNRIIVWKVDWEGKERNIVEAYTQPVRTEETEAAETADEGILEGTGINGSNTSNETE